MTDTSICAVGVGRRAPRNVKLEKPAPLKRSISLDAATVSTQNHETESNTIPTHASDEKENTFQGVRAPRRTNLKKPLPRSKSISEEKCESQSAVQNSSGNQGGVYENQSVIHYSGNQECGMTPNSARRLAGRVIEDVLSDLQQKSSNSAKPRLKSQVSIDSGVSDCSNNNNSGSHLNVGRNNSLIEVLPDEGFNEYSEDILTIEEELSDLYKPQNRREFLSAERMLEKFKTNMVNPTKHWVCEIVREPISPYTFSTGEEEVMNGLHLLTANGRRHMFRTYKNSCMDVTVQNKKLILYSADELLQIGANPLSQQPPESWAYLVHVFPGICLSKVDKYLNTELYQQERGYVVECHFVRSSSVPNDRHVQQDHGPFGKPFTRQISTSSTTTTTTTTSGVSKPRGGFGTPSKNKMTVDHEIDYKPVNDDLDTVYPNNARKRQVAFKKQAFRPTEDVEKRHRYGEKISGNREQTERYVYQGKEGLLTVHAKNLDLDTKCDVSARFSRGAVKLFAAARDELELPVNSQCRRVIMPLVHDEKSVSSEPLVSEECKKKKAISKSHSESPVNSQQRRVVMPSIPLEPYAQFKQRLEQMRKPRRVVDFKEDFYLNDDLPEQCPW